MSKLVTNDNLKAYHAELAEHIKLLQRNTAYVLDDIVNYDGIVLKCTTAGTTNTTKPNISSLSVGSTYTDGTCVWTRVDLDKRGIDYWASSTTYALNNQVIYNDKIYKCSTAHTSTSTFDNTKWTEISASSGGGIFTWVSGTSYSSGDLVIKDNQLYQANTTTSTTWVDSEWNLIVTTLTNSTAYVQKIVSNIVAPYELLVKVGDTNYCKAPINVLKKTGGSNNTILTLEDFNNSSAYNIDSDFIEIANGKLSLNNYKEYAITSQTLSSSDIGVSEEIDFDDFYSELVYGDSNTLYLFPFDSGYNSYGVKNSVSLTPSDANVSIDSVSKFDNSVKLNNSYLSATIPDAILDSDFTIDCWIRGDSRNTSNAFIEIGDTSGSNLVIFSQDSVYDYLRINGSFTTVSRGSDAGSWNHLACCREGNHFYFFFNGSLTRDITTSFTAGSNLLLNVGLRRNYSGSYGYVDELRISNIARWTSNFTPPDRPYRNIRLDISSLEVV